MFNDKPYIEVNREERFYCGLLAHALLASQEVRQRFADLIDRRFGLPLVPECLQVFPEAAALRDYWNDLGDPVVYSPETHAKRRAVLVAILAEQDIPASVIDQHDVFWTSKRHHKLWNPGRWGCQAIQTAGLPSLVKVKWAFNAKPDLLIVSGSSVLVVEAKLESGEGRDEESGYQQFEIQELIVRLLKRLVPSFTQSTFRNVLLALRPESGISWHDVMDIMVDAGLDNFTQRCLAQLHRFYNSKSKRPVAETVPQAP